MIIALLKLATAPLDDHSTSETNSTRLSAEPGQRERERERESVGDTAHDHCVVTPYWANSHQLVQRDGAVVLDDHCIEQLGS